MADGFPGGSPYGYRRLCPKSVSPPWDSKDLLRLCNVTDDHVWRATPVDLLDQSGPL